MKKTNKDTVTIISMGIVIICLIASVSLVFYNQYYYKGKNTDEEVIKYIIGVSQSQLRDPFQIRIYEEIVGESNKYNNIQVIFTDADGNSDKQIEDVNKLMEYGVDLLIISPTSLDDITGKVSEVYKQIPVIVLDREVNGYDYSLYIGPDNLNIGKQVGEYINKISKGEKAKIVEITGSSDSNATIDRSLGLKKELKQNSNIQIVEEVNADWNKDIAEDKMNEILKKYDDIDIIFAHSDAMALGAYTAYKNLEYKKNIKFISVDGLLGEKGGLELVDKSIFNCTFTSATGGKEAVQYALDILNKESGIPKKVILRSRQITKDNIAEYRNEQYNANSTNKNDKPITLGFCNVGKEGGWREANKISINNAAKDSKINLVYAEADLSQEKQIDIIRGFIKMKVDVISFSPVVEEGYDQILSEAKAAHIPVIIADRPIKTEDKTLYTTFIGSDFREEGRRAARWVISNVYKNKPINIIEIEGTRGTVPAIERKIGFDEVISKYEDIKVIRSKNSDFTFDGGKTVTKELLESVLNEGKEVNLVFAHNDDMALGAIKAIEDAGFEPGRDIKIVSIDAIKQAILKMREGKLNCTVECNPLIGPQIIKLAKDIVDGVNAPMMMITEEKVFEEDKFRLEWLARKY